MPDYPVPQFRQHLLNVKPSRSKRLWAKTIAAVSLISIAACGHPIREQSKALSQAKSIDLAVAYAPMTTIAPPPNVKPSAGANAGKGAVGGAGFGLGLALEEPSGLGLILLPITVPIGAAVGSVGGAAKTPSKEEWAQIYAENVQNIRRSERLITTLNTIEAQRQIERQIAEQMQRETSVTGACFEIQSGPEKCGQSPKASIRITISQRVDQRGNFDTFKGSISPIYYFTANIQMRFDDGTESGCAQYAKLYPVYALIPNPTAEASQVRARLTSLHYAQIANTIVSDLFHAHERKQGGLLPRAPHGIQMSQCRVQHNA